MQTAMATPGVYIAWCPWFDAHAGAGQLYKVGYSSDLRERLHHSAYVTCFPPASFRYVATFETECEAAARELETATLYCCSARRLGRSELVSMPAADIAAVIGGAAEALGLAVQCRDQPAYPRAEHSGVDGDLELDNPDDPVEIRRPGAPRHLLQHLVVPAARPADDVEKAIDELLAWNFEALSVGPVAAPETSDAAAGADEVDGAAGAGEADEADKADEAGEADEAHLTAEKVDGVVTADGAESDADESFYDALEDIDLAASPFDIANFTGLEMRDYQREAVERCRRELRATSLAILQMACRTGKTPVAYAIMQDWLEGAPQAGAEAPPSAEDGAPPAAEPPKVARVLYLVPGLALLRQTAQKLAAYGLQAPMLLVGSDPRPVALGAAEQRMTTDPAAVAAFLAGPGPRLVICTYHSSPLVPAGAFGLTIFDEAHRICGPRRPRPGNHVLLAPRAGARLYMTATPVYEPLSAERISMKDREMFGGVAYRYHLRQGIAAGHVNDFRLEIVAGAAGAADGPAAAGPDHVLVAMRAHAKLLVFCRDIAHAEALCQAAAAAQAGPAAVPVEPFECLIAHSRMGGDGVSGALRRFTAPGLRAAMFSVRVFQEGVEVPDLGAILFAAPRHSPRDIIQSLCRPLNRLPGKPVSTVYLPVAVDAARRPDDPANLKRFASIVPFVDALLDEDPRLYDHLLDPAGSPYPLELLGTHTLGLEGPAAREALLGAVRRAVCYGSSRAARPVNRLLRTENVPWVWVFGEIRRVVLECGHYPKTTDAWVVGGEKVCLYRFYRWAADEYARWRSGRPSRLEPHQIQDLQSLPEWEVFGVEGPYPWRRCCAFLEQWLREHGTPPMVEVNRGGYVGLEATAMERLSGFLTTINQQDGRSRKGKAAGSGFAISAEKCAELERICRPFGLRWRKERAADGEIVEGGPKTFIQEAHAAFIAHFKTHGAKSEYVRTWFPGYPGKHQKQVRADLVGSDALPPRWRAKKGPARGAARLGTRRARPEAARPAGALCAVV